VKHRSATVTILAVLVMALFSPREASAQFTTFLAPPRKAVDSAKQAIVAEKRAQGDSAIRMTLTDMKAWVDSAAGLPTTVAAADTAAPQPPSPTGIAAPAPARPTTTEFSNGAIAPNTASSLPALLLGGALTLVIGYLLFAWKSREA
jgi:hypothetical protein